MFEVFNKISSVSHPLLLLLHGLIPVQDLPNLVVVPGDNVEDGEEGVEGTVYETFVLKTAKPLKGSRKN